MSCATALLAAATSSGFRADEISRLLQKLPGRSPKLPVRSAKFPDSNRKIPGSIFTGNFALTPGILAIFLALNGQ
jgi:hypothetical protein